LTAPPAVSQAKPPPAKEATGPPVDPEQQEHQQDAQDDTVLAEAHPASNGVAAADDDTMDGADLFEDDPDGEHETTSSAAPDELLLRPGSPTGTRGLDGADLPEFDEVVQGGTTDEEGDVREPTEVSEPTEDGELKQLSASVTVAEASTSNSWRPSGPLAVSSGSAWTKSTMFGLATPPATAGTAYKFEPFGPTSGDLVVKPARFGVNIPLDPSHGIPVLIKDVQPAVYDLTSRLTDLLADVPRGPPGKLYAENVLAFVKTGGSCARIALVDESTAEHKNHFTQLRLQLERDNLFIVVLGSATVVLFSSQNLKVGAMLSVPDALLGLSKTLIISHIVVQSAGNFAICAMDAADLKLL